MRGRPPVLIDVGAIGVVRRMDADARGAGANDPRLLDWWRCARARRFNGRHNVNLVAWIDTVIVAETVLSTSTVVGLTSSTVDIASRPML